MTPPNTSALPLRHAPRSVSSPRSRGDNAAFVAERLAARRQQVRTIRKWVLTFAITLFLAVAIVIVAQSHLVSASSATTGGSALSSSSVGANSSVSTVATSSTSGTSSNLGTSSSSGSVSPVTSSQS